MLVVSETGPAVGREALEIYCAGLDKHSMIPPWVANRRAMAEVLFFGQAPGYPGLNPVNIRVPRSVGSGTAIPLRLTYLGRSSNEVSIGVK
jgi:uncharacterized protein (TIGR03437 family)